MDTIDLERWVPSASDSRKLEYAGARTAQEVYEELKYRLESMGYLPDEYFLMDIHWEDGREIPKDADIFCTVCQRQFEIVRKRRRNFVVFRQGG